MELINSQTSVSYLSFTRGKPNGSQDNCQQKNLMLFQHAKKLHRGLVTIKNEVNKLSPNAVHPNLQHLRSSVDNAVLFSADLLRNRMKSEITELLKEDVLKTSMIARKLIVPNGKRDKADYYNLHKVRRLLTESARMAISLHRNLVLSSGSHWKPSLQCPFFLKPPTLVFEGMTAESIQGLATALTNGVQSTCNTNITRKVTICTAQPSTDQHASNNDHDSPIQCQPAIQITVSTTLPSSSQVQNGNPSHQSSESTNMCMTTASPYWKPSLNCKFFLKPPTLLFKGLTQEHKKNLATILATRVQPNSNNGNVDKVQGADLNYSTTCRELRNALQTASTESKKQPRMKSAVSLSLEEKRKISTRLAKKLSFCLTAVQREVNRLSPKEVRPNLDSLKTSLDNALSLIKDVIHRSMTTDMTRALKEEIEDTFAIANKLRAPNSKRENSSSHGLTRAKRYLGCGIRMADALHTQIVVFARKDPSLSSSTVQTARNTCQRGTLTTDTTNQPLSVQSTGCQSSSISVYNSSGLKSQSNLTTADKNSNTADVPTHWKPSLNCTFFFKPSTLVFKGLTAQHKQSLARALAMEEHSKHHIISDEYGNLSYSTTCRLDPNNALQSTAVHSECKPAIQRNQGALNSNKVEPPNCCKQSPAFKCPKARPSVSRSLTKTLSKEAVLYDVVDVGLFKGTCALSSKQGTKHVSQSLKSPKKSFHFKPPKSKPAQLLHIKRTLLKQKGKIDVDSKLTFKSIGPSKFRSKTTSTVQKGIHRKVTFAKNLTSIAEFRKDDRQCALASHQQRKSTDEKPMSSRSHSITRRAVLKPIRKIKSARKLNNSSSANSQSVKGEPSLISKDGPQVGAEFEVTISDDDDHTQSEIVPRLRLGKRSSSGDQSPHPVKQFRFT